MIIPLLFPIFGLANEPVEKPSLDEVCAQISNEEWRAALKCIGDLVKLSKNKTKKNIARFKRKWPDFVQQIKSNDIMCKIAAEEGVWELFNELAGK